MKKYLMFGWLILAIVSFQTGSLQGQCSTCGVSWSTGYPAVNSTAPVYQAGSSFPSSYQQPSFAPQGFPQAFSQPVAPAYYPVTPGYAVPDASGYTSPGYAVQSYPVAPSYTLTSSPVVSYVGPASLSGGGFNSTVNGTYASNYVPMPNAGAAPATFTGFSSGVQTQGFRPQTVSPVQTFTPAQTFTGSGLAQQKAQRAANMNLRGHLGGSLGGMPYEGVGWSSRGPQAAIEQCCYWGERAPGQIGVARGSDGCWYACVLYH